MSQGTTPAKEENQDHLATNFAFLPFVVQLLSDKTPSQGIHPLPLRQPDALTLEAVEAVQDIINQATMAYLTQGEGWKKQPFVSPSEERPLKGRIWNRDTWRNLQLNFSENSLDVLLVAYNLTRKVPKAAELRSGSMFAGIEGKQSQDSSLALAKKKGKSLQQIQGQINQGIKDSLKVLRALAIEQNGDLLLHHQAFSQLAKMIYLDTNTTNTFLKNPLNLITHFHLCPEVKERHLDSLEQLCSSSFAPLLPWVGKLWAVRWEQLEPKRWRGKKKESALDNFHRFNQNQTLLFTAWYALAESKERPDLLVCMLDYYHALFHKYGSVSDWVKRFRDMTKDLRHMERTEYSDVWARSMMPALTLRRAYEDARELHPIDREAPHHLFMDMYQRHKFEEVLASVEQLIQILQPKIG